MAIRVLKPPRGFDGHLYVITSVIGVMARFLLLDITLADFVR